MLLDLACVVSSMPPGSLNQDQQEIECGTVVLSCNESKDHGSVTSLNWGGFQAFLFEYKGGPKPREIEFQISYNVQPDPSASFNDIHGPTNRSIGILEVDSRTTSRPNCLIPVQQLLTYIITYCWSLGEGRDSGAPPEQSLKRECHPMEGTPKTNISKDLHQDIPH